ncbi:MAG: methyltransferase domain-containing protein [bacterium]
MAVRVEPEHNETRALFDLVDFTAQHVLEIGCGDGRLTWRFAGRAAHVTAIDPYAESITRARENQPARTKGSRRPHVFDTAGAESARTSRAQRQWDSRRALQVAEGNRLGFACMWRP